MNRRVFAATLSVLLLTVPAAHSLKADAPVYTVEDLGTTSDGLVPTVTGMNASGQVSGYVMPDPFSSRAVRFTNGLGWKYLPGLDSVNSVATAINASGELTGYYTTADGARAFRYVDGVGVRTIPALPGGSYGIGSAIAANGDVVGYGDTAAGIRTWRASPDLDPVVPSTLLGVSATACGLNEAGQIVGTFTTEASYSHAFRLETDESLTDLGTLEGPESTSSACAIGVDGRVGGYSSVAGAYHAFLSTGGLPIDIDSFGSAFSMAEAISNGVTVGTFLTSTFAQHAFIHTDVDGTSDLNDHLASGSGWVIVDATAVNASGQIAGQGLNGGNPRVFRLTPAAAAGDTTAPEIKSLSATPPSVTPPNHAMVAVAVSVTATDDQDPNPVCTVTSIDGHGAPEADYSITPPLAGSVRATGGATYSFRVTCTDAAGNPASKSVDVVVPADTTPPVIGRVTATPSSIWPPNGAFVPVMVAVSATDDSGDAPVCALSSITGAPAADSVITAPLSASLRAVGGRTYSLNVTCSDAAGNLVDGFVNVRVPRDTTAPTITALSASPDYIWPPNGKMVSVTVSVSATDDVDATPTCGLASITGAPADAVITGRFTASVRANKDAVYTLQVGCGDLAGNRARATVSVMVTKDPPVALGNPKK